jgi:hypothetical protein
MNRYKLLITLVFVCSFSLVRAQAEFLVTVDPVTGAFEYIDSIPGVEYVAIGPSHTVFDEVNTRFIFKGSPDEENWILYTLDAVSGAVIHQPDFPVVTHPYDNIAELQFDNASGELYGVLWDYSEEREYFVTVDPATGEYAVIDSLPGVEWIMISPGYTTFDKNNHRYIFSGGDNDGNTFLYTVDALTAEILHSPPFPVLPDPMDHLVELQYDNTTNTLFGLYRDHSENTEYFVTVDPATGAFTIVNSIPGVQDVYTLPHYTTFDEVNGHYLFRGADGLGFWYLYSIDAATGNIVAHPEFPVLEDPSDHVIELQFDNVSGILYALHRGVKPEETNDLREWDTLPRIGLSPNPFSSEATLSVNAFFRRLTVFIYDSTGRMVRRESAGTDSCLKITRGDLPAGTYLASVVCDHQCIGSVRFAIE